MSKCSATIQALLGKDVCPACQMQSILHESEAIKITRINADVDLKKEEMRINADLKKEEINADLKKEEMKINAENNAKVLPLSHDFVYNSINFFS
jgi:hypothetical protein